MTITRATPGILAVVCALTCLALPVAAQRPWVNGELRLLRDNQPRDVVRASAEYGAYPSPAVSLALLLAGERLHGRIASDRPGAGAAVGSAGAATNSTAEIGVAGTVAIPAARLGMRGSVKALLGGPDAGVVPLWSAAARVDVGAGVLVRALAERDRYGWTLSSIDTLVLMQRQEFALDRVDAPGWAGQAVVRRDDFGDSNPVRTAYGWLLAPVSRAAGHSLRVGYAGSWQDAAHTTWQPLPAAGAVVPGPPPAPGTGLAGHYSPYHSPHDMRIHSGLVNAAVAVGAGWLRLDGSVGFHAREAAPVLVAGPTPAMPPQVEFYPRAFTPWRLGVAWLAPLGEATWITLEGARESGAYYRLTTIRIAVARGF